MKIDECGHCHRPHNVTPHAYAREPDVSEPVDVWACRNPYCWEAPVDVRQYDDGLEEGQTSKPPKANPHPKARRVKVKPQRDWTEPAR